MLERPVGTRSFATSGGEYGAGETFHLNPANVLDNGTLAARARATNYETFQPHHRRRRRRVHDRLQCAKLVRSSSLHDETMDGEQCKNEKEKTAFFQHAVLA